MNAHRPERIPSIKAVMTPFPWHVQLDDSLERAKALMREHRIRHLPITDGSRLVGVVNQRDVGLLESSIEDDADREALTIRDLPLLDAYVVELSEPLDRVLQQMATRHIDAALVVRQGKLAGIFTSTDACDRFAQFLRMYFDSGGNDAA